MSYAVIVPSSVEAVHRIVALLDVTLTSVGFPGGVGA
jgi:hypothetical protein